MKIVHLLVTVRKPELFPAALLVFKTLRIGFPTAEVYVWGNNLCDEGRAIFEDITQSLNGIFINLPAVSHDMWIEELVIKQPFPFWICDTDMVFFKSVEDWVFKTDFAGRHQPEYKEPWTKTINCERIHTCLQWLNPAAIRGAMMRWSREHIPSIFPFATIPFIRQNFIPHKGRLYLYDTTAGMYYTCSSTQFSDEQNSAFEHLHAGTYADDVSKCDALKNLYVAHQQIYCNTNKARGLKQIQDAFYKQHSI